MRKLLLFITLIIAAKSYSQTLFTYGTKPVSKEEFIKAFSKNPGADTSRQAALKDYLNLYINYKLKVQSAMDAGLQHDENYKLEADNFRNQLVENALNDEANINELVHEAFARSKKDIELQQLFIEVPQGGDTETVFKKINEAYKELQSGKSFDDVLLKYSSDSSAKYDKGYIGFITVFTLPYQVETLVYNLNNVQYSMPYHSAAGYHIFKKLSERDALGKRTFQQILIALPPSANEDENQNDKLIADSIYKTITNDASFNEASSSNNNAAAGKTFTINVGEYDPAFEKQVYTLKNAGDITKPLYTSYGYHIVKLVAKLPPDTNESDAVTKAEMQQLIEKDDRLDIAKKQLTDKWSTITGFHSNDYNKEDLWAFAKASLNNNATAYKAVNSKTVLFSFPQRKVLVSDWLNYLKQNGETGNNYEVPFKKFTQLEINNYYKAHIEEYNDALKQQVTDFNEANLLFAAMEKNVWNKAAADSIGLKKYYQLHHANYIWTKSISALVINAASKKLADSAMQNIQQQPAQWRSIAAVYGSQLQIDSSRFEYDQLPVAIPANAQPGFVSALTTNQDNTVTFAYVTHVFTQSEQKNFEDAKGLVINDYQQVLEDAWLATLKKKYPVKINEAVFNSIR